MKEVLVLLVMAVLAGSSQSLANTTDKTWTDWHAYKAAWLKFKKDFKPSFSSFVEEIRRYQIFSTNVDYINQANRRKLPYKLGINEFTLMTAEEFKASYLRGLKPPTRGLHSKAPSTIRLSNAPTGPIPHQFDWRTRHVVTPVKNQNLTRRWPRSDRKCAGCWAFSATGAIESALAKKTGWLVSLSEQQLLDCAPNTHGCSGSIDGAFDYVMQNPWSTGSGGIQTALSYPYEAKKGQRCYFNPTKVGAYMRGYVKLTPTENALKEAVYDHGPVSVLVTITQRAFYYYKEGVFIDNSCGHGEMLPNHAMLVVGYGREGGKDYWLVKNSWGTSWGEKGYIKMARNRNNMCGIASNIFIPTGVSLTPVGQNPTLPVVLKQPGCSARPAGVSPCSSSAMVAINTSLLMLLFAAIHSV